MSQAGGQERGDVFSSRVCELKGEGERMEADEAAISTVPPTPALTGKHTPTQRSRTWTFSRWMALPVDLVHFLGPL